MAVALVEDIAFGIGQDYVGIHHNKASQRDAVTGAPAASVNVPIHGTKESSWRCSNLAAFTTKQPKFNANFEPKSVPFVPRERSLSLGVSNIPHELEASNHDND